MDKGAARSDQAGGDPQPSTGDVKRLVDRTTMGCVLRAQTKHACSSDRQTEQGIHWPQGRGPMDIGSVRAKRALNDPLLEATKSAVCARRPGAPPSVKRLSETGAIEATWRMASEVDVGNKVSSRNKTQGPN